MNTTEQQIQINEELLRNQYRELLEMHSNPNSLYTEKLKSCINFILEKTEENLNLKRLAGVECYQ